MRRSSLSRLFDLADPLAIDDLGMRLAVHRNASLGTYIYFDGRRFPVRDDPPIAKAFSLLACGMGLECASNDPSLQLLCVNAGKCHANRFDRLAAEVEGGAGGKAYAEVILWYERMLSAIKSKNVAAFVDDQ